MLHQMRSYRDCSMSYTRPVSRILFGILTSGAIISISYLTDRAYGTALRFNGLQTKIDFLILLLIPFLFAGSILTPALRSRTYHCRRCTLYLHKCTRLHTSFGCCCTFTLHAPGVGRKGNTLSCRHPHCHRSRPEQNARCARVYRYTLAGACIMR